MIWVKEKYFCIKNRQSIYTTRYFGKLHFRYDILKSNKWAKKEFV